MPRFPVSFFVQEIFLIANKNCCAEEHQICKLPPFLSTAGAEGRTLEPKKDGGFCVHSEGLFVPDACLRVNELQELCVVQTLFSTTNCSSFFPPREQRRDLHSRTSVHNNKSPCAQMSHMFVYSHRRLILSCSGDNAQWRPRLLYCDPVHLGAASTAITLTR